MVLKRAAPSRVVRGPWSPRIRSDMSMLLRAASSAPTRTLSLLATAPARALSTTTLDEAAAGAQSFIQRAKAHGAQALLGALVTTPRFDRVLDGLRVTRIDEAEGVVELEFEVRQLHANTFSTLHGGFTATLVDVIGTIALLTKDPLRAGVSVELSVSYSGAANIGDRLRCTGRALKVGKRLGFSSVELRRVSDGALIAVGRHTKAYT